MWMKHKGGNEKKKKNPDLEIASSMIRLELTKRKKSKERREN